MNCTLKRSPELVNFIFAFLVIGSYLVLLMNAQKDCEAKGGVLIRSYSYTCVKGLEKVK